MKITSELKHLDVIAARLSHEIEHLQDGLERCFERIEALEKLLQQGEKNETP
jgi:hypothetical protein